MIKASCIYTRVKINRRKALQHKAFHTIGVLHDCSKQDAVRMDGVLLGIERAGEPEALGECRAASPSAAGGG